MSYKQFLFLYVIFHFPIEPRLRIKKKIESGEFRLQSHDSEYL